jgi:hypothetical protein
MRAFYATYRHIRLFVLGVPEEWLVAIYDLQTHEWLDTGSCETLKEAKADAVRRAAALLGTQLAKVAKVRWH